MGKIQFYPIITEGSSGIRSGTENTAERKSLAAPDTDIRCPKPGKTAYYTRKKKRKLFCKRAGIEPTIGHLNLLLSAKAG